MRRCFVFPPHLSNGSALPCKRGNPEIRSFHFNIVCCFANKLTKYNKTTTTVLRPFVWTTQVSRCQKKHSPTHHPDHRPIFISFFHLPRSIASSLFKLRAWQSFCTTSFLVFLSTPSLNLATLATCQPSYLYNLIQIYHPSRALRSSTLHFSMYHNLY